MHTTHDLIELAKQTLAVRHQLTLPMSDYRCAKLMDIGERNFSNWRKGRTGISLEFATRFAEATNLTPEYVLACLEHERATSPAVRSILESIALRFTDQGTRASILLAALFVFAFLNPLTSEAKSLQVTPMGQSIETGFLYIMRS